MTLKTILKKLSMTGAVCGGFWLAISPLAKPAIAQAGGSNCPNIFYQEPFTSRVSAPEGCPPTEYQQLLRGTQRGDLGVGDSDQADTLEELQTSSPDDLGVGDSDQASTLEELQNSSLATRTMGGAIPSASPPLPEDRSDAIAMVSPVDSQLAISLVNDTGTTVTYELVGDTQRRMLMMGESAMLQGVSLPATITVTREDNGLLDIIASSSEAGMLEVSLMPEASLDDTQGVIRIQEDGQVFVN